MSEKMSGDFSVNQGENLLNINLAIFGGSFNPPHSGHSAIIKCALKCKNIDMLIVLPNFKNPLKIQMRENRAFLDNISRINALNAMIQEIIKVEQINARIYQKSPDLKRVKSFLDSRKSSVNPASNPHKIILLSRFEMAQKKPSFAIESILHFKQLYAPKKLYFIIGADILSELDKWHKIDEIRQNAEFIVATRDKIPIPSEFLQLNVNENISSTEIRNATIHNNAYKNGTNLADSK